MDHRSLDRPHTICPISGPPTLKFYIVFVHLHISASGSEEPTPRPLNAVFIPDTASRVNECSSRLHDFQLPKNIILIIRGLCPCPINPSEGPTIFISFQRQTLYEPLSPSKELDSRVCDSCYYYHVAVKDSMPAFESSNHRPGDS